MSSRKLSPTGRNFLGGMLGGAGGILAAAYLGFVPMLLAVIAGVTIGWCHDYLFRLITLRGFRLDPEPVILFLHRSAMIVVVILSGAPIIMGARALAGQAAELGTPVQPDFWLVIAMIVAIFSIWPLTTAFCSVKEDDDRWSMRLSHPMRMRHRFMNRGPVLFFLEQILYGIFGQLIASVVLFLAMVYFVPFAFGIFLFIWLPIHAVLVSAWFIFRVALRRGSALCLAVTLAATLSASAAFYPFALSPAALWALALFTGGLSGCVTEGIRRTVCLWTRRSGLARALDTMEVDRISRYATQSVWCFVSYPWVCTLGIKVEPA